MKLIAFIILFVFCFAPANSQKFRPAFAPLQLEDTSGILLNTASLNGKFIYVDFWFTACAPCIGEISYSKVLQQYFAKDTNIVFLGICIENIDRKPVWKQMIHDKKMTGINLFYARNRPQNVNLLRAYNITFPTYILLNNEMKVVSSDMPRPSETDLVYWLLLSAANGIEPAEALTEMKHSNGYDQIMKDVKKFLADSMGK